MNRSKDVPLGEDTQPRDRIKQGISPSTIIEEWDCTKSDMRQITYNWDDALVCGICGKNDHIYYNLVVRHGHQHGDLESNHWCNRCCIDKPHLITVARYKEEMETLRAS